MNALQHCLLKLGEESGEVASALLPFINAEKGVLLDQTEVNLELNDLIAVIRKLNNEYKFSYYGKSEDQLFLKKINEKVCLVSWAKFTINACMQLSKITSKCIQFGLYEQQRGLDQNNIERLRDAVDEVFLGVSGLNDFGLGFSINETHITRKLAKIEHYLNYSVSLGCVSKSND